MYVHAQTHRFVGVWVNQCNQCQLPQCTCSGSRTWPQSEIILQEPCYGKFLRSETVSSTYSGKTSPLFIFFRSPCFACCLEVRSLCFTRGSVAPGSSCHPWERTRLFMGRMLCPCDPWVNPAVTVRSKSWHQSGEESCLFSQHVWTGWDDWRQTSHLLGSHTMRAKSKCYDVTLCAWFQLSTLLACKHSQCVLLLYYQWLLLTPNMSSKHFKIQIKSVFTGKVHSQWKFCYCLLTPRQK